MDFRLIPKAIILSALLPTLATAAHSSELPDGVYRCEMYSGSMMMHLGDIVIAGSTYQGPANGPDYGSAYEYELTNSGTINWGGPMGGFDSDGNTIVSTVLKKNGDQVAFDVMMQLNSGNFSTVSCSS